MCGIQLIDTPIGTGNELRLSRTLQFKMYAFLIELSDDVMSDALSPSIFEALSGKIDHTADPEPSEKRLDMEDAIATWRRFVNRVVFVSGAGVAFAGTWRLLMHGFKYLFIIHKQHIKELKTLHVVAAFSEHGHGAIEDPSCD